MLQCSISPKGLVAIPRPFVCGATRSLPLRHCLRAPTLLRETTSRQHFVCEAAAQSPDSSETSFVDYALGQGAYQLLTGMLVLWSGFFLFTGPLFGEIMWGLKLLPVQECTFRSLGALTIVPAVLCYSLQSAIGENRQDTPTYKRASFAVALSLLATCGFKFFQLSQGLVISDLGVWFNSAIQLLPTVAFIKLYGINTLQDIIPGFVSGVKSLFQPENVNAAFYSILTAISMAIAVGAMFIPTTMASINFTQPVDALGQLIIRDGGALVFCLSIALFTLKDAADKNRLGFITFRNLNIACFAAGVTKIGSALYVARSTMSAVGGSPAACIISRNGWIMNGVLFGGMALLSGYNALTAKKE